MNTSVLGRNENRLRGKAWVSYLIESENEGLCKKNISNGMWWLLKLCFSLEDTLMGSQSLLRVQIYFWSVWAALNAPVPVCLWALQHEDTTKVGRMLQNQTDVLLLTAVSADHMQPSPTLKPTSNPHRETRGHSQEPFIIILGRRLFDPVKIKPHIGFGTEQNWLQTHVHLYILFM